MEPSTPPVTQTEVYCHDCGKKLNTQETWEFRPDHDPYDDDRANCRRLNDDDDSIFVPLCDICYEWEEPEETQSQEDDNETSSYTCYCQGCGEEIDWGITKEEYEQDDELHLCSRCETAEEES